MKNKYDEAYDTFIFKIAYLLFSGGPISQIHIDLVDAWARFHHLRDTMMDLSEERKIPIGVEVAE